MGVDKAQLSFEGRTFLQRVTDAAADSEEVVLVGGDSSVPGVRTIPDAADLPRAAIAGVVTALEDAAADRVWIIAVEYPLLRREVLNWLIARFESSASSLFVPIFDERPQMLCAGYSFSLLEEMRRMIDEGEYRLQSLLRRVPCEFVNEQEIRSAFSGDVLRNVNEPSDYEALRSERER
jgi:molybdopterin-guanine dinucleotide biosynthesis protein A